MKYIFGKTNFDLERISPQLQRYIEKQALGGVLVKECYIYKSEELPDSSIGKWEFWAKNYKREKPKFPNLLILEHSKNHFIKPQLTK